MRSGSKGQLEQSSLSFFKLFILIIFRLCVERSGLNCTGDLRRLQQMEVKVWGWRGIALGAFGRWRFQDNQNIWKTTLCVKL